MSNYATLKAAIQDVIKTNGNNEITGALLQQSLVSIINSLGSGYQFIGKATPETVPGTPDQRVFYIGSAGTYPNFGPAVVPDGNLGIFYYDSSWHFTTIAFPIGAGTIVESNLAVALLNKLFSDGYKFSGIATPSTTPGTPNQNVFYIGGPGQYTNFGTSQTVDDGYLGFFEYNGNWIFETIQVGKNYDDIIAQLDAAVNGGFNTRVPIATYSEKFLLKEDGTLADSTSPTGVVYDFNVTGGETIKVSGRVGTNMASCMGAFFDAYGVFISSFYPATGTPTPVLDYEILVPNNATKVRVAGNTNVDFPYSPGVIAYRAGLKQDVLKIFEEIRGEEYTVTPVYVYPDARQLNKNTGEAITTTSPTGVVYEFDILGGGKIKVSGRIGTNTNTCLGAFVDNDGNFISSFFPSNGTGTPFLDQEIDVPNNAVRVRVAGNTSSSFPYEPAVKSYRNGIEPDIKELQKQAEFVPAFDIVSIPTDTLPLYISTTSLNWTAAPNDVKESYAIYKVKKGQRVLIVPHATNNGRYCFLSEYKNAAAGQPAALLPNHKQAYRVLSGNPVLVTIPQDCYLGVILRSATTTGAQYTPQHIYIEGQNFFKGLKSIWQGASVTQGIGCTYEFNRFSERVAQYLGMSHINYAISGSTLAKKPNSYERAYVSLSAWQTAVSGGQVDTTKKYLVKDNGSDTFPWAIYSYSGGSWVAGSRTPTGAERTPIVDRITEMDTDADVIVLQWGTNDFQYNWDEMGEDLTTDITTIKGAIRTICNFFVSTYPKKLIIGLTSLTPYRYQGSNTTPFSKNSYGYSGWDVNDAVKSVLKEFGIPVIEIGAELGLSPMNYSWWDDYDGSGTRVHPNDTGHRIAAAYLVEKLLNMKKTI